jgi:hypothetical protein
MKRTASAFESESDRSSEERGIPDRSVDRAADRPADMSPSAIEIDSVEVVVMNGVESGDSKDVRSVLVVGAGPAGVMLGYAFFFFLLNSPASRLFLELDLEST